MKPASEESQKSCTECGAFFVGHFKAKYCAPVCKSRTKERVRAATGYYHQAHVRLRVNEQQRAAYRRDVAAGKESGRLLAIWAEHGVGGMSGIPRHCVMDDCDRPMFARLKCKPHYQREMLTAGKAWAAADAIAGDKYHLRAEKYGVPFEQFNKFDVYDRDGWTCGICLDPVDPELMYPNPMSVSLDHVIPLSKGGGHLPSNTQCSHLSCNVRKGARYDEGIGAGVRVS